MMMMRFEKGGGESEGQGKAMDRNRLRKAGLRFGIGIRGVCQGFY